MAAHQDIAVELSLHGSQGLHVTPGYHLMTVDDTDLEVVNLDDLCLGETLNLVTITAHNMCLTLRCCEVLEPLNRLKKNKAGEMSAQVVNKSSVLQVFSTFLLCGNLPLGSRRFLDTPHAASCLA